MKFSDIDKCLLLETLGMLGPSFYTRELSEHRAMVDGHPHSGDSNYHSIIGRFLSDRVDEVEKINGCVGPQGQKWRNGCYGRSESTSAAEKSYSHHSSVVSSPMSPFELGPQSVGDNPFQARMRRHQSWYRANILRVPCGTGQLESSTKHYGNMLTRSDGAAGKNFLTPAIHEYVKRRLARGGGLIEPFRLLHNMLSSQSMCFNLFAPLADDLDLATQLVRGIWGHHIERVTKLEIEWAPGTDDEDRNDSDEFLGDDTAFDAFIEYQAYGGDLGFIGIETKLTESFSTGLYDKPTYRRWMTEDSPWGTDIAGFEHRKYNQLWRDHLLAWALHHHAEGRYSKSMFCVLYHPEDRHCAKVIDGYRALLRKSNGFQALPLAAILESWRSIVGPGMWLDDFASRYLDLHDFQ